MKGNLAVPGGSLKSKPMCRSTCGCSDTSVFCCAAGAFRPSPLWAKKEHFMTRTICLPILTGALAIAFCVAPLGPPTTKEATAQGIWVPSNTQPYYRSPQAYQSAYNYNSYGLGYSNVYQSGYRGYGASNYGTTVYSNGPYA